MLVSGGMLLSLFASLILTHILGTHTQIVALESEVQMLRGQVAALESEKQDLAGQAEVLASERMADQAALEERLRQLEKETQRSCKAESTLLENREETETMCIYITELQAKIGALRAELAATLQEAAKLRESNENFEKERQNDLRKSERETEDMAAQVRQIQQAFATMQQHLEAKFQRVREEALEAKEGAAILMTEQDQGSDCDREIQAVDELKDRLEKEAACFQTQVPSQSLKFIVYLRYYCG